MILVTLYTITLFYVKQFYEEQLELPRDTVNKIKIDRAHRIGKVKVGSVRPVVVKFHLYCERKMVRIKASEMKET